MPGLLLSCLSPYNPYIDRVKRPHGWHTNNTAIWIWVNNRGGENFKGKTHVIITITALTLIKAYLIDINYLYVIGAVIGSLLPDTDIKYSTAGKVLPVWLLAKHRGATHSLFAAFSLTAACAIFNVAFAAGLGTGYTLHLAADALTPMHLPYWSWYPGKKT